ncbi:MAG: TspO/MBR family protein [Flavicella sp.]
MALLKKIIVFLFLNFSALAIGLLLSGEGASSDWYQNLQKAPWTPPGWVFGAAWTSIMVGFSVFMSLLLHRSKEYKQILQLFTMQWLLNIAWNPMFFYFHQAWAGLLVLVPLTALVTYLAFRYIAILKINTLWISPYLIWLGIATSLNAYVVLYN